MQKEITAVGQQEEVYLSQGGEILGLANALTESIKEKWSDEELTKIEIQSAEIVESVNVMTVSTAEEYQIAVDLLSRIKKYLKKGEDYIEPFKQAAYSPYSMVLDIRRKIINPSEQAEKDLDKKIVVYREAEKKKQEEEQRKADEERKRKEAAERAKLEKKAEKAIEKGDEEKADELIEASEEVYIPPTIVEPTVQKTEKINDSKLSFRTTTEVQVVNVKQVLKAIVDGDFPETFVEVKIGAVKKWAKAMGVKNQKKHGLDIYQSEISVRNFC